MHVSVSALGSISALNDTFSHEYKWVSGPTYRQCGENSLCRFLNDFVASVQHYNRPSQTIGNYVWITRCNN